MNAVKSFLQRDSQNHAVKLLILEVLVTVVLYVYYVVSYSAPTTAVSLGLECKAANYCQSSYDCCRTVAKSGTISKEIGDGIFGECELIGSYQGKAFYKNTRKELKPRLTVENFPNATNVATGGCNVGNFTDLGLPETPEAGTAYKCITTPATYFTYAEQATHWELDVDSVISTIDSRDMQIVFEYESSVLVAIETYITKGTDRFEMFLFGSVANLETEKIVGYLNECINDARVQSSDTVICSCAGIDHLATLGVSSGNAALAVLLVTIIIYMHQGRQLRKNQDGTTVAVSDKA